MIAFPPVEIAEIDYTVNPWQDDYGQQWLYDEAKNRWTKAPTAAEGTPSTGGGVTVSASEPIDKFTGMRWFRTIDGVTYTYYDGFWVADGSAPAPDLADVWAALDTKLGAVATPVDEAGTSRLSQVADINAYVRFTDTNAKSYTVTQSLASIPAGSTITLRNAASTGNLVVSAENVSVTLNRESDAMLTVPPFGTLQLIKVHATESKWDVL